MPSSIVLSAAAAGGDGAPDPWALAELSRDVRPPDYATGFARQATQLSGLEWPVAVCARARPPWLEAVAAGARRGRDHGDRSARALRRRRLNGQHAARL